MGFSLKKIVKKVAHVAVRSTVAVGTAGLSEIKPSLIPSPIKSAVSSLAAAQFPTSVAQVLRTGVGVATGNPSLLVPATTGPSVSQSTNPYTVTQGEPMALNIGGILGQVGTIFGGNQNPYFQNVSNVANLASQFFPQPTASLPAVRQAAPSMQPTMVSSGAVAVRAQALTAEIFNAGLALLSRLGLPAPASAGGFSRALKAALGSIAALARRTPSGTMVSLLVGLGIAVYEANLLTVWFAQRRRGRRMNVANAKALRRAARRIKGFHRLCTHTDLIKTRSRSRGLSKCGTCRKSPCRC